MSNSKNGKNEPYNPNEAQRRFDAALRGAFVTPPKPMKDIPRKKAPKTKRPKPHK